MGFALSTRPTSAAKCHSSPYLYTTEFISVKTYIAQLRLPLSTRPTNVAQYPQFPSPSSSQCQHDTTVYSKRMEHVMVNFIMMTEDS